MGNDIAKLFGIEKEEQRLIITLLIQSVFLGIFYGVFNITAHSLFLARFDETIMARAYIISGLAGSGLTYLYTLLQSKLKFTGFSLINLGFILFITLILWLLISIYPENWVVFTIFIMLGPLNLLALLGFYGTTGRLFTLRQGKRLFGIVDTGLVVGVIVSSFAIPGLLSMNIGTHDIMLISTFSIFAALVIQFVIGKNYRSLILSSSSVEKSGEGMAVFKNDSYVMAMGLFIALSVVVMFFAQYSFMAVTRERYPEEQEMASFLGFFEGSMMVFTLLIKTFLFSYMIKNHGLKVTLVLGPVLIAIFTVIASIVGVSMGFVPGTSGFIIFFLVLAITRLFSKAMKDSVETPAFKVLYQTLAENVRYRVQSAIDGTINEIAALASGLLLTLLGALAFIKLIHFSWVLFAVVVAWMFSGIRLYNEYRQSVKKSLEQTDRVHPAGETGAAVSMSKIGYALQLLNDYFRFIITGGIKGHVVDDKLGEVVIRKATLNEDPLLLPILQRISVKNYSHLAGEAKLVIENIGKKSAVNDLDPSADFSRALEEAPDKPAFVRTLVASGRQLLVTDLLRMIRDNDIQVKRYAIYLVAKYRVADMIPELCECLAIPGVARDAYSVTGLFGEKAFSSLASTFFRSSGNTEVRILVLRLFSESKIPEAAEFLLPRLFSVHKLIRKEALKGLLNCGFNPDAATRDRLIQEVQDIIGLVTWNMSAIACLKEKGDDRLAVVVNGESIWWKDFLFDLLSLIYDRQSFEKIYENLRGGTVESVNYALEMLDIVVDDALKPRLTALLDSIRDEDKLKLLFQFYPGSIPDYNELVVDLINKDYNHLSIWTKCCALRSLYDLDGLPDTDFVIALLFSPVKILREEAARFLRERHPDVYNYCSYRIPPGFGDHLAQVLNKEIAAGDEIFSKVLFLSEFFPAAPGDELVNLAMKLEPVKAEAVASRAAISDLIVFSHDGDGERRIYGKWKECNIDNISSITIDIDEDPGYYLLQVDYLAGELFINPGLAGIVIPVIEMNLNDNE